MMSPQEAWLRTQAIRFARVINAARKHLPKWLGVVIGIALLIPGPQDELLVAVIIALWAAFKPMMRTDIKIAWNIYS